MYQFSRAIYLKLADDILENEVVAGTSNHEQVLRACESAIERLATDRHYFAKPARTLFREIRIYFPMTAQRKACEVVRRYIDLAEEYFSQLPLHGYDVNGDPLQCRATTRKGTACQRMPLPHNGYCPSHQHLAETEEVEAEEMAIAA
jgi:hypothetical protein